MKKLFSIITLCILFFTSCAINSNQSNSRKEKDIAEGLSLYSKLKGYPGGEMSMADYNLWSSFIIEYDTWRNSYSSKYGRKGWDEFAGIAIEKHGQLHTNLSSRVNYP